MKFSPKCRTKKLGRINTILGRFCSYLNWGGAVIWLKIKPREIPTYMYNETGNLSNL